MSSVFTIPPDIPFVDAVAAQLLLDFKDDPLSFASQLVLLPTRRACLHLREAFRKRMQGKASLLPRMQPLGDLDEDEFYFSLAGHETLDIPPSITPLRRQLLLAQLIRGKDRSMPLDQASKLADALARLLDEVQTEGLDFEKLPSLVLDKELAEHWQETVRFLSVVTELWPRVLESEGCIDPADRRNRVLKAQAAAWRLRPPESRVIAAGSTGSVPATATLLDVIAKMPNGLVVFPGLDQDLPEDAWQAITESHPQFGMKELLRHMGVDRRNVKLWGAPPAIERKDARTARVRLLQETMRPAEVTEEWRNLTPSMIPKSAVEGFQRLTLDHSQEEARVIALLMREALETEGKTAALVTTSRALAERVSVLLNRWDIKINDTGGTSLTASAVGGFLVNILRAAAPQRTPVDLLALLKHPFAALHLDPADCRARARRAEIDIWRAQSSKPSPQKEESEAFLKGVEDILLPLALSFQKHVPLIERIDMHRKLAEKIAASDVLEGAERVWGGEDGEAAANWLDDWATAGAGFPAVTGREYVDLFTSLAALVTLRPSWGLHPRLSILGPLEARLIHADLMILGGMNEGVWPPEARADPWMSRPMKKDFGLPLPERRIGLSAHDFVQLGSAKDVVLTRAARTDGAPTVPSRFLSQLETVLKALDYSNASEDCLAARTPIRALAKALDAPLGGLIAPCARPEPRPPLEHRPKQLSVTEIGTWQRNPYAIYAKHILKLSKLESLQQELDASDHGTIIHDVLEAFLLKYPQNLPDDALDQLIAFGHAAFLTVRQHPEIEAFWWPRFQTVASWFIAEEQSRRAAGAFLLGSEASGKMELGAFTLKGRADRIERSKDGSLQLADYKTGAVPSQKDVAAGIEPQLPLLGLMAERGAFKEIEGAAVSELSYWKLSGGREGSAVKPLKADNLPLLMQNAEAGLKALIAAFLLEETPYRAVPKPALQPRYDDYAHLARLKEWGRTEDEA